MVDCPIFLKRQRGVSFIEVLIVLAFIAALAVALLVFLNPGAQMGKARDARRKSDLSKLKNVLEDYYNDSKCYPSGLGDLTPDYIGQVPTNPSTKADYAYSSSDCDTYRIYVTLEYEKDPVIAEAGCQDGCGPSCAYNFGVCSSNAKLEGCVECEGQWYACQHATCNVYGAGKPTCEHGRAYCKVSCSGPACCDNECGTLEACCTDCLGAW